jgi:hypothetical protein
MVTVVGGEEWVDWGVSFIGEWDSVGDDCDSGKIRDFNCLVEFRDDGFHGCGRKGSTSASTFDDLWLVTHTAYNDISQWTIGESGANPSPMKYTVVPTADIANTEEPDGSIPTISVQIQATRHRQVSDKTRGWQPATSDLVHVQ